MESFIRTTDGVSLNHLDTGPGTSGTTVVLIAGFMAAAETWALQVPALTDAGHRVVCLDRRNHGRSDFPRHGQRMGRHGQDVHEALQQLDLQEVVLVGGSQGASAIWAYVDLHGASRLRGIVTVDQTPRMLNGDGWAYGFYGFDRTNAGTFFAEGIPQTGRGAGHERMLANLQRIAAGIEGEPAEVIQRLLPGVHDVTLPLLQDHALQDWRDVVARTHVPVLAVAGADSQYWPAEHAAATAALPQRGRAIVLEDCGHAANLDQPEAFNQALVSFIDESADG